jgi:hypothetical protein
MFPFSLFFKKSETVEAEATSPKKLTPESRVIAISNADDFVSVDLKKLSYAEVAALPPLHRSEKPVCGSGKQILRVVDDTVLEKDVTDVQMAETVAHNALLSVASMIEDEEDDFGLYNEKSNRLSKKKLKRLNKKGKGQK